MPRRHVIALVLIAGCVTLGASLAARESAGTPAARVLFDRGESSARDGNLVQAIAAFRKAIDGDRDFVDAHQRLIEVTQRQELQNPGSSFVAPLTQQYERWARQDPKRAVYQWALGLLAAKPEDGDAFFSKALALDPSFARAHFQLAGNADKRGDWDAQRQHLKAAVEGNPDEPRYLLRYAAAQKKSDPARFRELALQVVDKFPNTPSAAEALYDLAGGPACQERRGYFDTLRATYPVSTFNNSASAMNTLYAELPPADALALAREMTAALPKATFWPPRVAALEALTRAQRLLAEKRFADAADLLEKTPRPSGSHGTTWTLLKAEAARGAGRAEQAYSGLVESTAAAPDTRIDAALAAFGADLGKSTRDIDGDVWRRRDAQATPAAPFTFTSLRDGKPVQLADYRGRVVLVAFWYPT